jgi:hypothetical protein
MLQGRDRLACETLKQGQCYRTGSREVNPAPRFLRKYILPSEAKVPALINDTYRGLADGPVRSIGQERGGKTLKIFSEYWIKMSNLPGRVPTSATHRRHP